MDNISMDGKKVMVATSIAPFNIDNQRKAVDTWIKAGLTVISFNCMEEYEFVKEHFHDIEFKVVDRDGRGRFGKPYIFFDDIMEYFRECDYEVCGIINSDIYLLGVDDSFKDFIYKEAKESFIYGNRVEIKSLDNLNGMFYVGHDYFFFDKKVSTIYPKEDFWIGQPAWDYWVVFMPIICGYNVKKIINAIAYHISHRIQWNEKLNIELHKMIVGKYFDKAEELMEYKSESNLEKFYELILNYYQPLVYKKKSVKDYSILIVYNKNSIYKSDEVEDNNWILNQTHKNIKLCYGNKDSVDLDDVNEDLIYFMDGGTVIDNNFFDIMVNYIEGKDACICSYRLESESFNYIKNILPFDKDSKELDTSMIIDECILYNTEFYKKHRPLKHDIKNHNYALVPNGLVKKEFTWYLKGKLDTIKSKRLFIYGAGGHTKKLLNQINYKNYNICGIIDSNRELDGITLEGIPVYSRDKLNKLDIDYIVISSMSYEEEIYNDLKNIFDENKLIRIYNY